MLGYNKIFLESKDSVFIFYVLFFRRLIRVCVLVKGRYKRRNKKTCIEDIGILNGRG